MDFGSIIRKSAQRFPDNVAIWDDGRTQTYTELYERSSRLANALTDLGVEVGDRVALLGYNSFHTGELTVGLALGRFVRSGLYAHESAEVNGYLLDLIEAKALIIEADLYPVIAERLKAIESLQHVLVYAGDAPEGTISYEDALATASPQDPMRIGQPDDIHVIRFSGGTTGRPKGIVHTNERWRANDHEYRWVTPQMDERDGYLAAGQLTHATALWVWPTFTVGARIIIMRQFEPGLALKLIEEQKASFALGVPTMITALLNHPDIDKRDLSSLRCFNYAGSPAAETTIARALKRFGPGVLYQLYAQSEVITISMLLPHEHNPDGTPEERALLRSGGKPTPHVTVTVVDDDGNPLPPGEVGEIAAKGPGQMSYLWRNEEATAERTLPDGSILTRDMGYVDERGYIFLTDRKEDMIISGGFNIWPAELENALASHPAVREVCVVGVHHQKWGETPRAVVVLHPGAEVTEEELIEHTRDVVGSIKKVTSVLFADELPKSGVGKILRRQVREDFVPASEHQVGRA